MGQGHGAVDAHHRELWPNLEHHPPGKNIWAEIWTENRWFPRQRRRGCDEMSTSQSRPYMQKPGGVEHGMFSTWRRPEPRVGMWCKMSWKPAGLLSPESGLRIFIFISRLANVIYNDAIYKRSLWLRGRWLEGASVDGCSQVTAVIQRIEDNLE